MQIQLPGEIQALVNTIARVHGIPVEEYVARLVTETILRRTGVFDWKVGDAEPVVPPPAPVVDRLDRVEMMTRLVADVPRR